MGVLKPKQESEAINFKLPVPLKREIETLRSRAEEAGFDIGETITATMWRLCKQMKTGSHAGRPAHPHPAQGALARAHASRRGATVQRTISNLVTQVQDHALRDGLGAFSLAGPLS